MATNNYAYDKWDGVLEEKLGDLNVPTTDVEAYEHFPQYRWMFNKLQLSEKQHIQAKPHGIVPTKFPVFSKPMMNLYGLSAGTKKLSSWKESDYEPGHIWMKYLDAEQISVDLVINYGTIEWQYELVPEWKDGSFHYWEVHSGLDDDVQDSITQWVRRHFSEYRGCANLEMIGTEIIESVPRMGAQFIDFYGDYWLDAVARFYKGEHWLSPKIKGRKGYSYIVRVGKEHQYDRPYIKDRDALKQIEKNWSYSVYLPWYENVPLCEIIDDPHSYRIAVINSETLHAAKKVERLLWEHVIGFNDRKVSLLHG